MITVNGTTGESMSLSVAERKILAEEWCQKAKGRRVLAQPLDLMPMWMKKMSWQHFLCVLMFACLCRMDQVIVHVGCMSLNDSKELVSCYIYE